MIKRDDVFSSGTVFEQLADGVFDWATLHGILLENGATIEGQMRKLIEEAEEVVNALQFESDLAVKKEIGDVLVVLLILCRFKNFDMVECLSLTLDKLKKRTGHVEGGVFVKDAE